MSSTSIVPADPAGTAHMVLDDLGRLGRVWRELDDEQTSERNIIDLIANGQFKRPVKVVAFNLGEGWCRDVTQDIARALRDRDDLAFEARQFIEHALA